MFTRGGFIHFFYDTRRRIYSTYVVGFILQPDSIDTSQTICSNINILFCLQNEKQSLKYVKISYVFIPKDLYV